MRSRPASNLRVSSRSLPRAEESVRETPDWKEFMEKGAFNQTALSGDEYKNWVAKEEQRHYNLMKEAGFLAGTK